MSKNAHTLIEWAPPTILIGRTSPLPPTGDQRPAGRPRPPAPPLLPSPRPPCQRFSVPRPLGWVQFTFVGDDHHMSLRGAQRRSNLDPQDGRLLRFARNDMLPSVPFIVVW